MNGRLSGRRVALLAENMYQEVELWYPLLRLREEGAEVVVVAPRVGEYTSKHGYPVKADLASSEARAADFDAVVVPGGYAPDMMRRDPNLVRLVREADELGKVVAAVCHAGWMLCSADIVRGRRATSFSSIRDDMVHAGALWSDEECVVDGNLITSRQPADLPAFCRAIIDALAVGAGSVAAK
jgi:protease I